MDGQGMSRRRRRWRMAGGATVVALVVSALPARAEGPIDKDADDILQAMTDQLKGLKSFSLRYDTDHEIVDKQGQKIQYNASGSLRLDRASGFFISRQGPIADVEVHFDGKQIALHGKGANIFARMESPGPSIDEAIEEFRMSTGLDVAGADLLAADPYATLTEGVTRGEYVGAGYVGGTECDHLAFRNDRVDWQIWVSRESPHLPMKYVVTTKWVTGAPQYSIRFSDWQTGAVDTAAFAFEPPAGARQVEIFSADETGNVSMENFQ